MSKNEGKFIKKINELGNSQKDIYLRKLFIGGTQLYILYIQALTDRKLLSQFVIDPILKYEKKSPLTINILFDSIINFDDVSIASNEHEILNYILKGCSIIIIPNENKYIIANTLKIEKRPTSSPEVEQTLLGARDSFTENMNSNLSLIRYRLKDPSLTIHKTLVGKRTKTNVAIVYIKDIASPDFVQRIISKINAIKTDGILETGLLQKFLLNHPFDMFPQTGLIEKSDSACNCLLEGKICIIVEGSSFVLTAPKNFFEYFISSEDNYCNTYLAVFTAFLRFLCGFIYTGLSAIYVSVVAFNFDILPPQYAITLATARATVPFNAIIEVLLMEIIAELLRESSLRLPKQIGQAIGIVGTIIIGQAAVAAGVFSPLVVIITSLSTMSSFIFPDSLILNPLRIIKFLLIISTGILGLFGFIMMLNLIIINLVSQSSFGMPYFAPLAPFNFRDVINLILTDLTLAKKRPNFLRTKDNTRQ